MHLIAILIGSLFLVSTSQADDKWRVEFGTGSGWGKGFQIMLNSTNRYDYIESDFSDSVECTGALDRADFRSIRLIVNSILREEHPVVLTEPESVCFDEKWYHIKVEKAEFEGVTVEYGFSSAADCRAGNFPETVAELATKLDRLGATKIKGKCLKDMVLNPPNKPGFGTR
jgi:hypothetical protein